MDVITDKHDIELTIDKTYSNFEDFYSENKYGIFVGFFISLFYDFLNLQFVIYIFLSNLSTNKDV